MNLIHRTIESAQVRLLSSQYAIGQSKYRRIYFFHVQKAGGSSIRRSFYNLAEPREKVPEVFHNPTIRRAVIGDKVYVSHHVGMINQGYYFFASSHLPQSAINLPENTFTFTCLRNPVKRFLSRYRELLRLNIEQPDNFHLKQAAGWFSTDFMNMLEKIPDEEILFQLRMFSENLDVNEAVENVQRLSYFFLTNEMQQGIQYLIQHLDLPLELYHERKTNYDYELPDEQLSYLKQRLQPAIDMYQKLETIYYSRASASS